MTRQRSRWCMRGRAIAPDVVTPGMAAPAGRWSDGHVWIGTVRTQPGRRDRLAPPRRVRELDPRHLGPGADGVRARRPVVAICRPGDLIHVPAGIVHREITEGDGPVAAVLFRVGTGR